METSKRYENFPFWIVAVSNLLSFSIYAIGFYVLFKLGWLVSALYLAYVFLFMELRIISRHCIDCYYYGKTCGFGKGRVSALLFKKGDTSRFCRHEMTWKEMIPDMLVSLIPLVTGIILLFIKFDIELLLSLVLLVILTTVGNGFVRGNLSCKYCIQRDIGCPAEQLFSKTNA
jgi:hypothetical protein